jgi:glucokinase
MRASSSRVIGIDIGGTKVAAFLGDGTAATLDTPALIAPTPEASKPAALDGLESGSAAYAEALAEGQRALLATIIGLCEQLIARAEAEGQQVLAVGVGSAGQIDPLAGVVLDANENLVGWAGARVAEAIREACGLPAFIDNDVRVMALAETTLGAARGYRHALCITVGTGIGGAIILNDQVWHGAHFSAGEIGYLYAEDGQSIEGLYSGPAIARHYAERHPGQPALTLPEIAARAHTGDAACAEAITSAARGLGLRLAPVLALLDPEALVVGGGVPEIGPLWWDAFMDGVRRAPLRSVRAMPVVPARLGSRAGMIGAAVLAARWVGLIEIVR